jgi:two-component system chemotaxis sensor kinase CheA
VNEVIRFNASELIRTERSELISYRDIILPVLKLNRFFNLAKNENPYYDTIVVGYSNEQVGIAVDRIIGQREIVVRPLPDPFVRVDGISGATELGEGKIVLILDAAELVRAAMSRKEEKELSGNHKSLKI